MDDLAVQVERLAEPQVIWDLHQLFSTTAYGFLHLPDNQRLILSSVEAVDTLEEMLDVYVSFRHVLGKNADEQLGEEYWYAEAMKMADWAGFQTGRLREAHAVTDAAEAWLTTQHACWLPVTSAEEAHARDLASDAATDALIEAIETWTTARDTEMEAQRARRRGRDG